MPLEEEEAPFPGGEGHLLGSLVASVQTHPAALVPLMSSVGIRSEGTSPSSCCKEAA